MRFYKLRMTPDAAMKATGFNEQLKPELIPEQNDPFRVEWIYDIATEPFYVGEKVRQAIPIIGRISCFAGVATCRSCKAGVRCKVATYGLQVQRERLSVDRHDYRRHRNYTRDNPGGLIQYQS